MLVAAEASRFNSLVGELDFLVDRSLNRSLLNGVLVEADVLGLVLRAGRGVYGGVIGRAETFTVFTLSDINGGGVRVAVSVNLNTSVEVLSTSWTGRMKVSEKGSCFGSYYVAVVSMSTELGCNRKPLTWGGMGRI